MRHARIAALSALMLLMGGVPAALAQDCAGDCNASDDVAINELVTCVNIALGTDTYPRDMILQMRNASYFGKVASRNLKAATAAQVFEAATLAGARSVGRDDIGRLAPGTKADIVIIGLTGSDTLRLGPVRDPIKSLVDCGIGDDVDTVIVDGVTRMENGRIPGVDFAELRLQAQAAGERVWSNWQNWDPHGRSADEMSPFSFPRAN